MAVQDLVRNISESVSMSANVNAVFGESRTVGNKTIIPIAVIGMGFGAGGGEGKATAEEGEAATPQGSGGGGGGGSVARPLAIVEVTEGETKIIPIIDLNKVVLTSIMVGGCITGMLIRMVLRLTKR